MDAHVVARWHLVLGKAAEDHSLTCAGDPDCQRIEELVGFLFDEGGPPGAEKGRTEDRRGGSGASTLTVPRWVDLVRELFPHSAKEVLERELIRRRGIGELLEKPELLEKIEPNTELVKTLLTHKDLLTPQTRVLARKVIEKVVNELKEKLKIQIEQAITGALAAIAIPRGRCSATST